MSGIEKIRNGKIDLMYAGVKSIITHVRHLLISHLRINFLCCMSKSIIKHQQKPD